MKGKILIILALLSFCLWTLVAAASLPANKENEKATSLAIIYANHAGKYEKAMDRVIHRELPKRLKGYRIVDAQAVDRRMQSMGMENPIWLEREDLHLLTRDLDADYLVLFDLREVYAQKKVTVLTKGNEATGSVAVKIMYIPTGRYVYVGELNATESKMTILLNTGKKTTSGKVVEELMKDMAAVIRKVAPVERKDAARDIPRDGQEEMNEVAGNILLERR